MGGYLSGSPCACCSSWRLAPACDADIAIEAGLALARTADGFELSLRADASTKAAVRLALREPRLLPASTRRVE